MKKGEKVKYLMKGKKNGHKPISIVKKIKRWTFITGFIIFFFYKKKLNVFNVSFNGL